MNIDNREGNIPKETEKFNVRNSAPIEHYSIGSTPWIRVNGQDQPMNVEALIKKASEGDEEALKTLLTPIALVDTDIAQIELERELERQRKTRKGLGIIFTEGEGLKKIRRGGTSIFIEPSRLDLQTGLVEPRWNIYLVDVNGKRVDNQRIRQALQELALDRDPQKPDDMWFYNLSQINPDGSKTLVFNHQRQK
ncbi:hypothetical protein HYZ05_01935 [Candidatus Daviesbacteria bacterium]|nr:hypothetical protein [Candidatus Daviesbacteria bacterium]